MSFSLTWARTDLFVKVLVSPRTRKVKLWCMLMEMGLPLLESKAMAGKIGLPSRCLPAFARESRAVVVLILMRTGIPMQWGRIPRSFGTRSYSIQDKVLYDEEDTTSQLGCAEESLPRPSRWSIHPIAHAVFAAPCVRPSTSAHPPIPSPSET